MICAYCGEEKILHKDHFVPLSKGGEFTHNNVVPSCACCNVSKSNNDFFEWYEQESQIYTTLLNIP